MAVRQLRRVADYAKEFVEKSTPLGNISRDLTLGAFINGLKEDTKCELRLMDPSSLRVAIKLAEKIHQKNKAKNHFGRQQEINRFGPYNPKTFSKLYPQT